MPTPGITCRMHIEVILAVQLPGTGLAALLPDALCGKAGQLGYLPRIRPLSPAGFRAGPRPPGPKTGPGRNTPGPRGPSRAGPGVPVEGRRPAHSRAEI